jgi:hypothetical protein
MIRFVFAIPLIVHGLAHLSGFFASWTTASAGYPIDRPWLFSPHVTLTSPIGKAFGLLWLVAAAGLAGSGLGLLFLQEWWTALAAAAAVVSLVVIVPWWRTVPPGAWVGAGFDVLVIVLLLTPVKNRIIEWVS